MMMNYLNAVKADYQRMIERLSIVEDNITGFYMLSHSTLEEAKEAYNSETGQKILRNSMRIYNALQALKEELEAIEL